MPQRQPGPLPEPSRLVLNAGILTGGLVGFLISQSEAANALNAFVITAVAALIGAAVFSYAEILLRRRNSNK